MNNGKPCKPCSIRSAPATPTPSSATAAMQQSKIENALALKCTESSYRVIYATVLRAAAIGFPHSGQAPETFPRVEYPQPMQRPTHSIRLCPRKYREQRKHFRSNLKDGRLAPLTPAPGESAAPNAKNTPRKEAVRLFTKDLNQLPVLRTSRTSIFVLHRGHATALGCDSCRRHFDVVLIESAAPKGYL
jgi:hypothetical protein